MTAWRRTDNGVPPSPPLLRYKGRCALPGWPVARIMHDRLSHIMTTQIPANIQLFVAYRFPTSHTASTHAPAAPACCHNTGCNSRS